jgi:hypothetical protein
MIRRNFYRSTRTNGDLAGRRLPRDKSQKRTSLDHLPGGKQRELAYVVEVLTEAFGTATTGREAEGVKHGQILTIVLFGSYARGDWVEEPCQPRLLGF